ncbi:MAG: rod shape-determining protein MreC [Sulfurimonas sp.]|uniref:rod shape-determining protein MreC n=1 Tax=Sulfurimonas sp. TaxID=2022749 RepID=UPI0025F77B1D|nr:rod shape-determining protein MreC [Sulfurimonas sp.]MCK9455092.1 rod shape-determining protein MreC [Sulfurimonas sp.]
MNKGLFGFFLLFTALFAGAFYYTNIIQTPFISALNNIKSNYHASTEFIQDQIEKHFFQARHIEELKNKLKKYENSELVMQQLNSEIDSFFTENNSSLKVDSKVELVRTLSYQKFGDLNRLWLEVNDFNTSRVYGLVYKKYVAGIVVSHEQRALALLNRDIKSSYSVYIGEESAPGIAHGNSTKYLVVKFIPAWYHIKKGDEVITSGLDEIFFKGLKVGRVLSVTFSQGYQNAIIEPYYKANKPNYFHMIKKVK